MVQSAAIEILIKGDATGVKAAIAESVGLVGHFKNSAEKSAQAIEKAFAAQEKSLDRLRASVDPLYAASKKYEAAVGQLDRALKHGIISQAEYARLMDLSARSHLGAQQSIAATTGAFGVLGRMSDSTRNRLQMVSYQVQDVAVQLAGGARASTVFAQQGSQIASAFGPVGAIIGTLAAVTIPLLAVAFSNSRAEIDATTESVRRLKEAQDQLATATYDAQTTIDKLRFGVDEAYQVELLREQVRLKSEYTAKVTELNTYLATTTDNLDRQRITTAALVGEIQQIAETYRRNERALADQQDRTTQLAILEGVRTQRANEAAAASERAAEARARDAERTRLAADQAERIKRAIDSVSSKSISIQVNFRANFENFTGQAAGWASDTWARMQEIAGVASPVYSSPRPRSAPAMVDDAAWGGSSGGGGGGGGGGASPIAAELESLQQSLRTQEQLQLESFQRQQETLQQALNQRLITQQEYAALMEQSQKQHQEKMSAIDVYRYGTTLEKAETFLGDMATAFSTGNDKMLRISRIFGAAQALISTYQGAAKALELPFPANIAAAAKVIGAGMGFVRAIRSGSTSAGAASSTAASTAVSAQVPTQNVTIQWNGPDSAFNSMSGLIDTLNEAGKRGMRLNATLIKGGA